MKSRSIIITTLLLLLILYGGACNRAGLWLARDDHPRHADAMVLLMGGIADRVLQIADLYHQGVAPRIIIVTESMGAYRALEERGVNLISSTQQVKSALVRLGVPPECITILPGDARSTLTEAQAVSEYLAVNTPVDTLLLVSSAYHMRRAGMIFRRALRKNHLTVTLLCSPSSYTAFRAKGWWRYKEEIQAVMSEYIKIGSFIFLERGRL